MMVGAPLGGRSLEDCRERVPGSVAMPCATCRQPTLFAPSSFVRVEEENLDPIWLCFECADPSKAAGFLLPSELQMREVKAAIAADLATGLRRMRRRGPSVGPVHVLAYGAALCSNVVGVPASWPEGHTWVSFLDRWQTIATCAECRARAEQKGAP